MPNPSGGHTPHATPASPSGRPDDVTVGYEALVAFTAEVFGDRGVPAGRARTAAEALVYGDLTGLTSHGLTNLTRLYLPAMDDGRIDPLAEPEKVTDTGPAVLLDGRRSLGLWSAAEALTLAADRAETTGIAMVTLRNATHFGCAGFHTGRIAERGMVAFLASNCGGQRILRPPGGRAAMLGTNPFSVAAPAGEHEPYILDMSTSVVPTGRVRAAAREGRPVPEGWLEDAEGRTVTDPHTLDEGTGYLRWLGGDPSTGAYKGYGLGLMVEVLAALVPGAGFGPAPEALDGDGRPTGRDDDIGITALVLAPGTLRPGQDVRADADGLFGSLLDCPPMDPARPVSYPGRPEAAAAERNRRDGVPLAAERYEELRTLAAERGLDAPPLLTGGAR
ncbi:Ldh family oxidoreductase [Streptomyces sp. N2-109]|uniref:Ldh family oxidoreductase n=1 Tax=Streptomyces gossypii TaxID=2883101 RepID=A0ABT2JNW1_9ACTN|nr:Ldh family oxidoreductase [Streptomyces gossypii]MCT2589572.1 Ldh family oxidoreductase [Streptomyces gossypii]